MSQSWALRWLAMLLLFSFLSLAFSSVTSATTLAADDDRQPSPNQIEQEEETNQPAPSPSPTLFMQTITQSALLGALLGALVGTSLYFLTGRTISAWNIVYVTAGGVLFGTAVGAAEVVMRERRAYSAAPDLAEGSTPLRQAKEQVPRIWHVPLYRFSF